MQLLTRREYNLILRSLDKYELYMNSREKELSEKLQDKLYYNLYNPKDGVAQTNIDLAALYRERFISLSCSNCSQIAECLRCSHHKQLSTLINNHEHRITQRN